jgi:hypothetical protein
VRAKAAAPSTGTLLVGDVVGAIAGESQRQSLADHNGAQILAGRSANYDDALTACAVLILHA